MYTIQTNPKISTTRKYTRKRSRDEVAVISSLFINLFLGMFVFAAFIMQAEFDEIIIPSEFNSYAKGSFIFIIPCVCDCLIRLSDRGQISVLSYWVDVLFLVVTFLIAGICFACIFIDGSAILSSKQLTWLLLLYPGRILLRLFYDLGCLFRIKTSPTV